MAKKKTKIIWPPPTGGAHYVNSDAFGSLLIHIVGGFSQQYPRMDFTDAVAQVFEWFSGRLAQEPDFLETRFSNASAFRAYLRQAIWNAGRLAARRRERGVQLSALPFQEPIRADEVSVEELAELSEAISRLVFPYKDVLERLFFDEDADAHIVAASMGLTVDEYYDCYEQAIDMLELRDK